MRCNAAIRPIRPLVRFLGLPLIAAAAAAAADPAAKQVPPPKQEVHPKQESRPETPIPAAAAAPDYRSLEALLLLIESDAEREIAGDKTVSLSGAVGLLASKYQVRAGQGDRDAQFKLGAMYLEGICVRTNYGEAWRWFVEAGGAEHPLALVAHGRHLLKRSEDELRSGGETDDVIRALGKMGPAVADFVPELSKRLDEGYPNGYAAAEALARIGPFGLPELDAALKDPRVAVRRSAAAGLSEVPAANVATRKLLEEALQDPDSIVRERAGWALKRVKARERSK